MFLVSVLSAAVILSVQVVPPAPLVTATRTLDHVTLKARAATITHVMETLKQEAQIESAEIDPKFAGVVIDGEWTAKDWDELLFVALSRVPELKVLVAGGPDGTDWQVVAGSEAFLTEFKLKPKARVAEKAPGRSDPQTKAAASAADIKLVPEVIEPVVEKTEEETKEEQEEASATFTAIVSPPAGPPIAGQHVVLPFPDESGNMPMATRQAGPLQLPFPGYTAPAAGKGPYPPSKDPALQALIDIVNQSNAAKK